MARFRFSYVSMYHCMWLCLILFPGDSFARPCETGAEGCISRGSAFAPADSGGWTGGYAPENGVAPPVGPSGNNSSNGGGGGGQGASLSGGSLSIPDGGYVSGTCGSYYVKSNGDWVWRPARCPIPKVEHGDWGHRLERRLD